MKQPIEVTAVDMAFGGRAMEILPKWEEIPKEFKSGHNDWCQLVSRWFFSGLPKGTVFEVKPGIDKNAAMANLRCALGSFEPKHEHKEAGCAYLLSLWFDRVEIPKEPIAA